MSSHSLSFFLAGRSCGAACQESFEREAIVSIKRLRTGKYVWLSWEYFLSAVARKLYCLTRWPEILKH